MEQTAVVSAFRNHWTNIRAIKYQIIRITVENQI